MDNKRKEKAKKKQKHMRLLISTLFFREVRDTRQKTRQDECEVIQVIEMH